MRLTLISFRTEKKRMIPEELDCELVRDSSIRLIENSVGDGKLLSTTAFKR